MDGAVVVTSAIDNLVKGAAGQAHGKRGVLEPSRLRESVPLRHVQATGVGLGIALCWRRRCEARLIHTLKGALRSTLITLGELGEG